MALHLYLVRHGQAASGGPGGDAARPLTERGTADAREQGRWLAAGWSRPAAVVASPARRTRETAAALLAGAGATWGMGPDSIRLAEPIYDASLADLVELVCGLPERAETALLVGHNPGISELAAFLAAGSVAGFAPGTVVVMELPAPVWGGVAGGTGAVLGRRVP